MKIINFTDVITNSSSEVFTFYDKSTISIIKDAVNGILSLVDSEHNFDDYFTIELDIDESVYDRYPNTEYKDLVELAIKYDNAHSESLPCVTGYTVTAKDPKNKEIARLLNKLDEISYSDERYI